MAFKRALFNPAGPFLARKNFGLFGDVQLKIGKTYDADVFARLHARRIEQLYNAGHIWMGEPGKHVLKAADLSKVDPLDRDASGDRGGSLSDAETAALAKAGLTPDQWRALPTKPERDAALAAAVSAAAAVPTAPPAGAAGGTGGAEGGAGGPETARGAAEAGSGGGNGAEAADEAEKPAVAVKAFGFGRYWKIDATGGKVGGLTDVIMGKGNAEALAAQLAVPLLGQNDHVPGQ